MGLSSYSTERQFARDVVSRLRAAGYEALWAGGCVRDELLGITPKDYDVATNAQPDDVRKVFGRRRTIPVGAAFGVITVLGRKEQGTIEVATFREDASYSDGRRPDSVRFTTAERDAQRRDFTINGLFYDPVAQEVLDYVGGRDDLQQGVVRAIGTARDRIAEDKLRMLRAIRFAARFGFEIEPITRRAIVDSAEQIAVVSPERIGMEVRNMLEHPARVLAFELMAEHDLLERVLPWLAAAHGEYGKTWQETQRILNELPADDLSLVVAALFRESEARKVIPEVGRQMRWPNRDLDHAIWFVEHVEAIGRAVDSPWSRLQPILAHPLAARLLVLYEAIRGEDAALRLCRERLSWPPERLDPPPLLTGKDLIDLGQRPGPAFAKILQAVRDAQLMGEISTREEAIAWLKRQDSS